MRRVDLNTGHYFAVIDDEDYDRVVDLCKWHVSQCRNGVMYANGKVRSRSISMHRFILGLLPGDPLVDHIDRDGLNNQKSNLRLGDQALNMQNQAVRSDSRSGFRGVGWHARTGKWRARCRVRESYFNGGLHTTPLDAAIAAEGLRRQHMPFAQPDPALVAAISDETLFFVLGEATA